MKDEEVLSLALDRFKTVQTAESDIRDAFLEDVKFTYNVDDGQWDDTVRQERQNDNRPCLTVNKLRKFVAQVANKMRDSRMGANTIPVDDDADVARAKIFNGIIRNIEYQSDAQKAYAWGAEMQLSGGLGYWRILTEYVENGFDQEIKIKKIDNPLSVYYDPKKNYCFIRTHMTVKDFKAEYADQFPGDFDYASIGQEFEGWYEDEKVYVAEYFSKEPFDKQIAQIKNPLTGETSIIEVKSGMDLSVFEVLQTRIVKTHKVMWYKITANKVLEKRAWVGKNIPIIEVKGDEINVSGKLYKRSLVRDAKSPQMMYNYWLTAITEKGALAPKAPFILKAGWIKGHQHMWDNANTKNYPYLLVNDSADELPVRQQPIQIDSGPLTILNIANNDIKDTFGMYEPSLGESSNERTGRAIYARQQRSDVGTYHFVANFADAVLETARQLIDLIPKIYDTERIIRIRDFEGAEEAITINQAVTDDGGKKTLINDLTVGKYDVRADAKSYSTRRQETNEFMIEALQYAPQVAPLILDLMFKYSDVPGAKEIETRIQQVMPMLMQGMMGGNGEGTPTKSKEGAK